MQIRANTIYFMHNKWNNRQDLVLILLMPNISFRIQFAISSIFEISENRMDFPNLLLCFEKNSQNLHFWKF